MKKEETGNVRRNGGSQRPPPPTPPEEFRPGDIVGMIPTALKMDRLSTMSPRLLVQLGWPNAFMVRDVFETPDEGVCLTLGICCHIREDHRVGRPVCAGHQAIYFRKLTPQEIQMMPEGWLELEVPPDLCASIKLPFGIGKLVSMDYRDQDPRFKFEAFGKGAEIAGPLAKQIAELLKDNNIL